MKGTGWLVKGLFCPVKGGRRGILPLYAAGNAGDETEKAADDLKKAENEPEKGSLQPLKDVL